MVLESNYGNEGGSRKLPRKHIDYASPDIKVYHIEGKGKGMFSMRNFAAGELVMVAKALVFAQADPREVAISHSATTNFTDVGHQTRMLLYLIDQLLLHAEIRAELYSLSAGSRYPDPVAPENLSKVDILRMTAILTSNTFNTQTDLMSGVLSQCKDDARGIVIHDLSKNGSGLWLGPSLLNHSCHVQLHLFNYW